MRNKKNLFIQKNKRIIDALNMMDEEKVKLLIVMDGNDFFSLISMGDIQRNIIKNGTLNGSVEQATRKDFIVVGLKQSDSEIKNLMAKYQTEFMPIVNERKLIDIIFWDDVFGYALSEKSPLKNVPVLIMAGGVGSRLKPLTNIIPKPMVPIGDKTIMELIIKQFSDEGADEFYATVNYKSDMLKYYFSNLSEGIKVNFVDEDKPLGTGGSISFFKNIIKETFFVSNCDILIDQKMSAVYKYHKEFNNVVTIISSIIQINIPYGTIETTNGGALERMEEKPSIVYQINTGVYILEPEVFNYIKDGEFQHITDIIMRVKAAGGNVGVFPVSEKSWRDIGQWPQYINSVRELSSENNFEGL